MIPHHFLPRYPFIPSIGDLPTLLSVMDEKTRLLPAVQTIYGSTSNGLKIRRCLYLLGVVTAVVLAGLTMWRLFFDEPAADEFICGDTKNEARYIKLSNKQDDHYFYWFFEAKHNASTCSYRRCNVHAAGLQIEVAPTWPLFKELHYLDIVFFAAALASLGESYRNDGLVYEKRSLLEALRAAASPATAFSVCLVAHC